MSRGLELPILTKEDSCFEAASAVGSPPFRTLLRHLVPVTRPPTGHVSRSRAVSLHGIQLAIVDADEQHAIGDRG